MDATQRAADEPAANGHEKAHYGSHAGHGMHAGHAMPDREPKHHGHDAHAGHSVGMFRDKFWVSLLLTLPSLVWGHMLQRAFRYTAPHCPECRGDPVGAGKMRSRITERPLQHVSPDKRRERQQQGHPELVAKHSNAVAGMGVVAVMLRVAIGHGMTRVHLMASVGAVVGLLVSVRC